VVPPGFPIIRFIEGPYRRGCSLFQTIGAIVAVTLSPKCPSQPCRVFAFIPPPPPFVVVFFRLHFSTSQLRKVAFFNEYSLVFPISPPRSLLIRRESIGAVFFLCMWKIPLDHSSIDFFLYSPFCPSAFSICRFPKCSLSLEGVFGGLSPLNWGGPFAGVWGRVIFCARGFSADSLCLIAEEARHEFYPLDIE